MRRALAVVLLVVVGCSSATSATTVTVGGQAGAATTVATTTTVAVTTAVAEDDCPLADRGYQCPPDLALREPDLDPAVHSPGTYRTRLFQPVFEFVQESVFSGFESDLGVRLDEQGCNAPSESCRQITILPPALSAEIDLADLAADDCAADATLATETVLGFPAVVLDFHVPTVGPVCIVVLPIGHTVLAIRADDRTAIFYRSDRTRFYKLALSDETEILINVLAPTADFDEYLTEVAQPILDSIRFLDQ